MVTKQQLTEGALVKLTVDALTIHAIADTLASYGVNLSRETYVVRDLMDRKTYNREGFVGIGPADRDIAFRVSLDQIALA